MAVGGSVCLLVGFVLGVWATLAYVGGEGKRRAAGGLAPTVAPPPPPPPPPIPQFVHELEIIDDTCADEHAVVVAACARCNLEARCHYGDGFTASTRADALERISKGMRAPVRGTVHLVPDGVAAEIVPPAGGLPS